MSDDIATAPAAEPSSGIDIAAASEQIGASLFDDMPKSESSEPEAVEATAEPAKETKAEPVTKTIPSVRQPPKSWVKDMHDRWAKVDPAVQDYIEKREKDFLDGLEQYKSHANYAKSIQDVLNPYKQLLNGMEPTQIIPRLLEAQKRLTSGTIEQRRAAYQELGRNLQLIEQQQNGNQPPQDPRVDAIQQQLEAMHQALTAQQLAQAKLDLDKFADDKKAHPHFDEVMADTSPNGLEAQLRRGLSLQDAYDSAVRLNPVIQEQERQLWFQTETEKAKERARLDALPKKQAKSVNVQSKDTQRTPTEPLGSFEDTMRATLKEIKARV